MRAELGRQQGPELSQLSFLLAQSAATQIIPGRAAWTNKAPGRSTHSPGGKAWHAGAPKDLFTTGAPNHNVSPIFQFSSLGKKNPIQFYSFNFLENYLKKTEQKNHNDFKNTKQAGGEGLFSISELTHEGWAGQGAEGDAPAWLSAPAGHGHRGQLPIFSLSFTSHALQFKGT